MTEHIDELRTIDSILDWFERSVSEHQNIPPAYWIQAAQQLVSLMGNEMDTLYLMQQNIAKAKVEILSESDGNVSATRLKVEATDEFRQMRQQEGKLKRVEEFIRLAKLQSRMRNDEMRGYKV